MLALDTLFAAIYVALWFFNDLQENIVRKIADGTTNIAFIFCHWVFVYQYIKVALLMPIYLEIDTTDLRVK